ncbi:cysteine desulfurase family protein [Rothia sp. ZJ1223]|uniref:cysteine desulfurase family protein n=1 Tax=Rothia sp. ZJ1223 TaxID=2811098 RepID=UPI0019597370|nr:cysteine desulfurase family protein [Rothia sp. ZJ1223]MBM7050854.1 cysteine desulfurase [Rothia sp. ZJ1223]
MERIYLDHAATTSTLPAAMDAVMEQMRVGGNPSSLHSAGRRARATVEAAREDIARLAHCDSAEVIFTSGGTEADNLAVKGLFWKRQASNPRARKILVSSVEHHAVSEAVEWLEKNEDAVAIWLSVDATGRVDPDTVRAEIAQDPEAVALVTVMWANNEVGTIQPVAEIAAIASEYGVPMHTDAVQAFGTVPVDFRASDATTMAISGHKIGAPMGVGALIATRAAALEPVLHGGGQERSVRSGTIDAASIAGFAAAARAAGENLHEEANRLATLRNRLIEGVQELVPDATLRGATPETADEMTAGVWRRLPGNAHFTFAGCEGDSLLFLLDMAGIESSTGSACNAGVPRPSHVLLAMGLDEVTARGAQRFTLGHSSTDADVDGLLAALPAAFAQAQKAGLAAHTPDASLWH